MRTFTCRSLYEVPFKILSGMKALKSMSQPADKSALQLKRETNSEAGFGFQIRFSQLLSGYITAFFITVSPENIFLRRFLLRAVFFAIWPIFASPEENFRSTGKNTAGDSVAWEEIRKYTGVRNIAVLCSLLSNESYESYS